MSVRELHVHVYCFPVFCLFLDVDVLKRKLTVFLSVAGEVNTAAVTSSLTTSAASIAEQSAASDTDSNPDLESECTRRGVVPPSPPVSTPAAAPQGNTEMFVVS